VSDSSKSATSFHARGFSFDNLYSSAVTSHEIFFSFTKCMSFTQSILRLSAIAEDGKSHTKLGVACCAIGFKWRRNSIYRKVTAAMTPRMCMHVLGGLRADCRRHCRGHFWTPDLPPTCPRTCRRQIVTAACPRTWRRHCLPINASTYFNVTCHTTDALPPTLRAEWRRVWHWR